MEYQHCDGKLFAMVGHILEETNKSGRVIVRNEVTQAKESLWSRQLAVARAAITDSLASNQDTTLIDFSNLRLDSAAE